jgi:uncharacterized metal-binding protein
MRSRVCPLHLARVVARVMHVRACAGVSCATKTFAGEDVRVDVHAQSSRRRVRARRHDARNSSAKRA